MGEIWEFSAEIISEGSGGAFVIVPIDIEKEYGRKRLKVKVTFDGVPYRGSIVRMGLGEYILGIRKDIQKKIGRSIGEVVTVSFQEDLEPRIVYIPEELRDELDSYLLEVFRGLSYSKQKRFADLVSNAKKEKTRNKRIEKILTELRELS